MTDNTFIAPSILSADFAHLAAEIESVEKAGADLLHLDIMDGHFVPNITIGPPVVASIRRITNLPLDAHLMISEPARYVDALLKAGVNWLSVHAEADNHLHRTIQYIRSQGACAGVALNPATPITALEEVIPDVDFILLMSVNPGFGGQKFIPSTLDKIRKLRDRITSNNYRSRIEVDGGIDTDNISEVVSAGADMIVAGYAIFKSKSGPAEAIRQMKKVAQVRPYAEDRP